MGITAASARPTAAGAFWLAMVISLPVGALLCVIELALRLLG